MKIKLISTIIIAKMIIRVCRLFRLGGTSLPGEIARKIYPGIVRDITRDFQIIMVTGTNGKTTTTKILGQILQENGIPFITNKSGANLVDGITTTFIESVDFKGKCGIKTALLEIDEGAFDRITNMISPHFLLVTNFFRDQLDRYGELYTTLKKVKSGILKSPGAKLVLNADDSLCASLGKDTPNAVTYFGFSGDAFQNSEEIINSDATFCMYCKSKYDYSNRVYGHLGGFRCPGCGYARPDTSVTCTWVEELTSAYSKVHVKVNGDSAPLSAKVNLPGLYNIYNALSAAACAHLLGLPAEKAMSALANFESGFGRMETICADGKNIKLILVKNPAGFNQVLTYLLTEESNMQVAFLINDNHADGTDVSWLWDVDFEKLNKIQEQIDHVYVSGVRAEDMAVRLKYAGIYTNRIEIEKDYAQLVQKGLSNAREDQNFYILPTYTAMLDIRKVLKQRFGLKEFWK